MNKHCCLPIYPGYIYNYKHQDHTGPNVAPILRTSSLTIWLGQHQTLISQSQSKNKLSLCLFTVKLGQLDAVNSGLFYVFW